MGKITLCIMIGMASLVATANQKTILKGHPPVVLEKLLGGLNQEKAILALKKVISEISPVARGTKIDEGRLGEVYKESLQSLKTLDLKKSTAWLFSEGELWFQILERISFEEGRFSALIEVLSAREKLWNSLLEKLQSTPEFSKDLLAWLKARKPTYPVDRIFLLESKARWPNSMMKAAEKITQYLQKKSDIPLAVLTKSVRLPPTKEVQDLEKEWSEVQVQLLRQELGLYEKLLNAAMTFQKTASD